MESHGAPSSGASAPPSSELSRSCLNGILIVCCFCVVFFFFFFSFPLECVSSLCLCGCLSWHLHHHCQDKSDFLHQSPRWRWHLEPSAMTSWEMVTRESGKQETRDMNAPSGHLSSIHQLPGCTPKMKRKKKKQKKRKQLYFSLLCAPGRPYQCATGEYVSVLKSSCVYRPIYRVPCLVMGLVSINPFVWTV